MALEKINFFDLQRQNTTKTFFLIFIFLIILAGFGYVLGLYFLKSAAPYLSLFCLGIGTIQSLIAYYAGDQMILATVQAREINSSNLKEKQAGNIVQEMALAAGLPIPRVYVFQESSPNAFATGRDAKHSSIAVTSGLLDALDREELQGVIGHEMAHIRNRDILTMTIVSALLGSIVLLSDFARRSLMYQTNSGIGSRERKKGGGNLILFLIIIALIIIAPVISRLLALACSRMREYMADAGSVEFTRNPKALGSALEKISLHYDTVVDKATQATSHLFISNPLKNKLDDHEGSFAEWWSTHPPIHKRIALLRVMF